MKFNVKLLEQIGQTQSIHQHESGEQMFESFKINNHAFETLKSQNQDLVCVLFPDDDDEE